MAPRLSEILRGALRKTFAPHTMAASPATGRSPSTNENATRLVQRNFGQIAGHKSLPAPLPTSQISDFMATEVKIPAMRESIQAAGIPPQWLVQAATSVEKDQPIFGTGDRQIHLRGQRRGVRPDSIQSPGGRRKLEIGQVVRGKSTKAPHIFAGQKEGEEFGVREDGSKAR